MKIGHIEKNGFGKAKPTHSMTVAETPEVTTDAHSVYGLFPMSSAPDPVVTHVQVDGTALAMEVDTGAAVTIISQQTFNDHWWGAGGKPTVRTTKETLRTNTGETVKVAGVIDMTVTSPPKQLPVMIVPGNGPSLLGRNWLAELPIDWRIHQVETNTSLDKV